MNRRSVLKRGGVGVAALVALSGCTEETLEEAETHPPFLDIDEEAIELPIDQRADVVEAGILRAEDAEIGGLEAFEEFLDDQDLSVEALAEEERVIDELLEIEDEDEQVVEEEAHGEGLVLELEFVQPDRIDTGILHSIGLVAGGYAALVDAGFDGEKLEATILDSARASYGTFDVLTSWAEEYNEGVTSARVYGSKPWIASKTE